MITVFSFFIFLLSYKPSIQSENNFQQPFKPIVLMETTKNIKRLDSVLYYDKLLDSLKKDSEIKLSILNKQQNILESQINILSSN